MPVVRVKASASYEVQIGQGLLQKAGALSRPLLKGDRVAVVSDETVGALYEEEVQKSFAAAGFAVSAVRFPAGEQHKTPETLMKLLSFLAAEELTRVDAVVALGGGVTGDMAGLAAALYLRGIPCVMLPTTLLSMVDSSVGGKTAVDLPEGKNLMGTFTQPVLVLCDTTVLKTLPRQVCAEGFAEIIKYGMIRSDTLLRTLEAHTMTDLLAPEQSALLEEIITECVAIKRDVVAADEKDFGERQLLNFGHTLGHAIERCAGFSIYHGEGVAMGMAILTRACVRKKDCPAEVEERLHRLLAAYELPEHTTLPQEAILAAARADKKRRGDKITLVLPAAPGRCKLQKTDYRELEELLALGYNA